VDQTPALSRALTSAQRDLLALHIVPGIGPRLLAALLERFGTAAAVRDAGLQELASIPHLGEAVARQVQESLRRGDVDKELALMERHGVRLVLLGDSDYPVTLSKIDVPPRLLFVRGEFSPLDIQSIAVVGSRTCTSYGKRLAQRLGYDLAKAGCTVVSGLARGIDGMAHRGALDARGRTIAVLAGGLSKIYPPEHTELAEEIVNSGGALITEASMLMEPMAGMFPARNRIISGLSRAVVLVEAAEKSGALITARHAAEQGREVFAVPGPVDSIASAGTLHLLRNGAKLVRHAGDVLDDVAGIAPLATPRSPSEEGPSTAVSRAAPPNLDDVQQAIWDFLTEPRSVDDLCRGVRKPIAELTGVLMTLELKRVVRRLPGNVYERW
jgi:DNA processing protein